MKYYLTILLTLCFFTTSIKAEEAVIEFSTEPAMDKILPDAETALLKFVVKNKKGEPIKNARLTIKCTAPQTTSFFSTDFPIVEGTPLMDLDLELVDGQAEIEYLLPIRGIYDLQVTASPTIANEFEATTIKPPLILNEVPSEVNNFCTLSAILIIFGLASGFVLGRSTLNKLQESENE